MSVASWPVVVTKCYETYICTPRSYWLVAACSNSSVNGERVALEMSISGSIVFSARGRRGEVQRAEETLHGSSVLAMDMGDEP